MKHESEKPALSRDEFRAQLHKNATGKKARLVGSIIEQQTRLRRPGDTFEMRILRTTRGTMSGYFDDLKAMAQAAARYDGIYNIYVTLNPVRPELLARAKNRLLPYAKATTSDADILERRWLPIDIDPVRPTDISSSEEEKTAAKTVAYAVRKYLRTQGWPDPILASSGNGYHLLYPIDLPNDGPSRELVQKVLQALSLRFSSGEARVDTANYNAARIWKAYGTVACKGDNTEERPHRRAKIISKEKS